MNDNAGQVVHAHELTTLASLPGPVMSPLHNNPPNPYIFALDLGPSTSSDRFSIPAISEHAISLKIEGCGHGECRIGGQFSSAQFAPGGLALVPSGADSEWRICDGSSSNFNIFLSPSLVSIVAVQTLGIDPARAKPIPRAYFEDPIIFQIGMEISRTIRKMDIYDLLYLESLSHTLSVHLLHYYISSPASLREVKGELPAPLLKQVLDYIDDGSDTELTLAHMAVLAHMSPFYFERLFKESTGQTVHTYVMARRLEKSYRLLLSSSLSLAQIAAEMGFADQSHFERRFKSRFGVPPGALRKDRKIIP